MTAELTIASTAAAIAALQAVTLVLVADILRRIARLEGRAMKETQDA